MITKLVVDSGVSDTDGITNNGAISVTGTATQNLTVTVAVASSPPITAQVQADSSGNWIADFTAQPLPDGTYAITATETDGGGVVGPSSAPFTVTIDTVVPTLSQTSVDPAALSRDASVDFVLEFSETVTPVITSSLSLTTTGNVTGSIASVKGLTQTYTVTVDGLIGIGTAAVQLGADTVIDIAGNRLTETVTTVAHNVAISHTIYLPLITRPLPPAILNGDFESGALTPWASSGALATPRLVSAIDIDGVLGAATDSPLQGQTSLLLGDPSLIHKNVPIGYSEVKQTISVRKNQSQLKLDYRFFSHDFLWHSSVGYIDTFEIFINTDTDGGRRDAICRSKTPYAPGNGNGLAYCTGIESGSSLLKLKETRGTASLDLSDYVGQDIELIIRVYNRNDQRFNSWAYVDHVRFE